MPRTKPDRLRHTDVDHERQDVRAGAILWFAFWLLVSAVVIHVGLWGLFRLFAAQQRREQPGIAANVSANLKRTPAEPRLEALPLAPRQRLRAEENAKLSTYGWVDRTGGVARIPIDRAMQLIVEHGVPGGKPMAAGAPAAQAPRAASETASR